MCRNSDSRNCESQCLYDFARLLHPGTRPSIVDLTQLFGHLFLTVIHTIEMILSRFILIGSPKVSFHSSKAVI
jgi:hypothetical protein